MQPGDLHGKVVLPLNSVYVGSNLGFKWVQIRGSCEFESGVHMDLNMGFKSGAKVSPHLGFKSGVHVDSNLGFMLVQIWGLNMGFIRVQIWSSSGFTSRPKCLFHNLWRSSLALWSVE